MNIGQAIRFVVGMILEAAMLWGVIVEGVEISPFVLALPFGLMGYDLSSAIRAWRHGGDGADK